MRRFIVLAGAVFLVLVMLGIASGAAIARTGPFLPGNPMFAIQDFSEQVEARLKSPAEQQAAAYIELAKRRVENLIAQTGSPHESDSLAYLDLALDQAVRVWSSLPVETAGSLRAQILYLLEASRAAAGQLSEANIQNPGQAAAFLAKVSTLASLVEASEADPSLLVNLAQGEIVSPPGELDIQVNLPDATIDPLTVPFPAGSFASEHEFFPLTGQHTQIECEACHAEGVYDGTANECETCHADEKPDPHYTGDCAACHSTYDWDDISFDHMLASAADCASCHLDDKPENHFAGQCSACHSTNSWQGARFNHQAAGATDCKACHMNDKPSNHFGGQCSACHTTNNWEAEFSHNGQSDCKACHLNDKPGNHFGGQCSACHSTNSWQGASFNHQAAGATDCKACHVNDKPSNHFGGQCSACHTTNDWEAEFSHNGQSDCKACHAGDRPGDHDSGQCSNCHNTRDWDDGEDGDDDRDNDEGGNAEGDSGGDNGGESGGDDDDDEDDEEEQGSLVSPSGLVRAGFHSPLACSTCHDSAQTAFEKPQAVPSTAWWQTIVNTFQNMVKFSIG